MFAFKKYILVTSLPTGIVLVTLNVTVTKNSPLKTNTLTERAKQPHFTINITGKMEGSD